MISIDITILFQFVNFIVTLLILNYLIIRPVREMIARRRAHNASLLGEAQTMNTSAAQKLEGYEARLLRVRADMANEREKVKQDAGKVAQARLDAAGEEARGIRQEATGRLQAESAQARAELEARVADFARMAADRVLGA